MEQTPLGTSVGVDDPYAFAGRCDFVTDDGRCRFAIEHATSDRAFARERRREDYACPVVEEESSYRGNKASDRASSTDREAETDSWRECSHYRSRTHGRQCVRCGLEERRTTDDGERPLLDEHHLSYAESESALASSSPSLGASHEITVSLCRWCHAKVHNSWARIGDDASPDPEAIAAREGRRSRERAETAFETAAKRREDTEE